MFTLPLDDPLWKKLDDAHRNRDIAEMVQSLIETWESEAADELFWDHLCHQDTCYGATYAAVPHLLALARATTDSGARQAIAGFLGHVSRVAPDPDPGAADDVLQGLPTTLEGWHRKLDVCRDLKGYAQRTLANTSLPQDVRDYAKRQFEDVSAVLELPAVDAEDLKRIDQIRSAFFDAQTEIATLCAETLPEIEAEARHYGLEGVAAALGDRKLAALFASGRDGTVRCAHCLREYDYLIFGTRMALYPLPELNAQGVRFATSEDASLLDYRDGAPNRAAGFVKPWDDGERTAAAEHIAKLLAATKDAENDVLLQLFTGTFACVSCGKTSRL